MEKARVQVKEERLRQKWRGRQPHKRSAWRSGSYPKTRIMRERIDDQLWHDERTMNDKYLAKSEAMYISYGEWCGLLNRARNGDLAGAIRKLKYFETLSEFTWVTEAKKKKKGKG